MHQYPHLHYGTAVQWGKLPIAKMQEVKKGTRKIYPFSQRNLKNTRFQLLWQRTTDKTERNKSLIICMYARSRWARHGYLPLATRNTVRVLVPTGRPFPMSTTQRRAMVGSSSTYHQLSPTVRRVAADWLVSRKTLTHRKTRFGS